MPPQRGLRPRTGCVRKRLVGASARPELACGPTLNDKPEAKAANVPKVSGLERSRELSTDVPFALPIPSPQPVAAVIADPTPAPSGHVRHPTHAATSTSVTYQQPRDTRSSCGYQPVDIIQPTNHVLPASFGDSDWYFVTGISLTSTNESSRRKPPQHDLQKQGMPDHELLRQELNNRFLVQSSDRAAASLGPFDKYAPKLDNPYFRHSNTSNPIDVAGRPGTVHHTLLQKTPGVSDPYRPPVRKPGKWCAVHVQIAWQIYHHQQKIKQMQLDPHKLDIGGKLDLFSRPPAPGVFPGFHYPQDLARPLFSTTDPFSRSSTFSGLGNLGSNAFGGLGSHALTHNNIFTHKDGPNLQNFNNPHEPWNRLHRTPPSFPTPPQWPKPTDSERSSSVTNHDRDREREREPEKRDLSLSKDDRDKERDLMDKNRHSNRSSPASAPVTHQISNLIRSNSQTSSDPIRQVSLGERERSKEPEREHPDRLREPPIAEHKIKESRSPVKETPSHDKRPSEDNTKPVIQSVSPYSKPALSESLKLTNLMSKDMERKAELPSDLQKIKNDIKVKEERKEDSDVLVVGSEPSQHSRSVEHPPPPTLHGLSLPHSMAASMPISMGSVHQMNNMNVLDRSRMMTPLIGMNPLSGRERLPHPGFSWDPMRDPLRDAYRSLDLHRRMDFQLRTDPIHRFPTTSGFYDHERSYRDREPHDYNHENLLEARREQERLRQVEERERLHLREELERARMHHLHSSPIESHLAHVPSFMPHLSGMHYPRLSPSTAMHNGILNRNPPTAALSAPPPLVPASSTRPASPRRTTPLTNSESRDYSPSRNPKEVEAR
ncbi:fibrosin-1-like protein isoform x10 [Limosa lapponica baueri]|uniref:Fibrosin-1-like protein isoform x10 n=1 Tax=Limosa lapponica baueri TaxID=1758121 RepID=A0A2I0U9D0_LIMLA|nr:fibrosin-1-like protein isoform x10 [Limosa lapponica baueri]